MLKPLLQKRRELRFPWRLFFRVVFLQAFLILIVFAGAAIAARAFFRARALSQASEQLKDTLQALSEELSSQPDSQWCIHHSHNPRLRLTLLNKQGLVICTSSSPIEFNMTSTPRFEDALNTGFASSFEYDPVTHATQVHGTLASQSLPLALDATLSLSVLDQWMRGFDIVLGSVLIFFALILTVFTIWSGRALVIPVGRLLLMAKSLDAEEAGNTSDNLEFLSTESTNEWLELESSIHNLRRDLKRTTESLSLEREEVATLMGSISDGILAVDKGGQALFFNARFVPFLRQLHARQKRVHLAEVFRNPELHQAFDSALEEGKTVSIEAFPIEMEGHGRFFALSIAPLRRKNQEIYGAVGVFHDVTELKRAEQIRIDFVANVSHELRTPLTSLRGYVETLLLDAEENRPLKPEYLKVIARNTQRLGILINDLLDISSLEAPGENLQKEAISTEEVSARAIRQLETKLASRHQSVSIEAHASTVFGDASRIEQVLVNLLDNAHKFTPEGSRIRILWEEEKNPAFTILKVIDQGPGIAAEHVGRLFERFYRVEKARSRDMGGTGLGLAIVKHIVQRHKGTVRVESILGQGATFICTFPIPKEMAAGPNLLVK